jgi:hypothetical protein
MSKKALYLFTFLSAVVGYGWLFWNYNHYNPHAPDAGLGLCLFRHITGLACPSCGVTRSVMSLYHLHLADALYYNPIGLIIVCGLSVLPIWVAIDTLYRNNSFYTFYRNMETVVRKHWVAIPLITLLVTNWIWNIYKYTA